MTPDSWMPYYGSDFEGAMKGYRREVKWSYLAALWHYWSHTHCAGLPNADDQLQLICECPDSDWARTKGLIFSGRPLFYLSGNAWHQDRAKEEYTAAVKQFELRRRQTEAARLSRSVTDHVTDSVTGSVTDSVSRGIQLDVATQASIRPVVEGAKHPITVQNQDRKSVTDHVTDSVTGSVTATQPQPQPHTVQRESRRFAPPSLNEVKLNGLKIGLPDSECAKFFAYYESNGWKVGRNSMKSWPAAMIHWRGNWQERAGQRNTRNSATVSPDQIERLTRTVENI